MPGFLSWSIQHRYGSGSGIFTITVLNFYSFLLCRYSKCFNGFGKFIKVSYLCIGKGKLIKARVQEKMEVQEFICDSFDKFAIQMCVDSVHKKLCYLHCFSSIRHLKQRFLNFVNVFMSSIHSSFI